MRKISNNYDEMRVKLFSLWPAATTIILVEIVHGSQWKAKKRITVIKQTQCRRCLFNGFFF